MLFCLSIAVFFLPTFLSLSLCLSFTLSLDLGFNTCVLCATSLFLCVSVFFLSLFTLYRMIEKKIGWYCRQQCVETYGTYEMTYEIAESTILKIKKKWKERDTEMAKKKLSQVHEPFESAWKLYNVFASLYLCHLLSTTKCVCITSRTNIS